MHDVLDFLSFLYFPQITQYNSSVFLVIENILVLRSTNVCYYIFVPYNFFDFLWNMFNCKTTKIYYVVTIHTQRYPITYAPSFILGKLFRK